MEQKGKSSVNDVLKQHRDRILPPIVESLASGNDEALVEKIMAPDIPDKVRGFIIIWPVKKLHESLMMAATPDEAAVLGANGVLARLESVQRRANEVYKERKEALKKAAGN